MRTGKSIITPENFYMYDFDRIIKMNRKTRLVETYNLSIKLFRYASGLASLYTFLKYNTKFIRAEFSTRKDSK